MNASIHHFSDLFAQLGLPSDEQSIQQFVSDHSPLPADVELPNAPFWTSTQAAFLGEAIQEDSDWAILVDQLSGALRRPERKNK